MNAALCAAAVSIFAATQGIEPMPPRGGMLGFVFGSARDDRFLTGAAVVGGLLPLATSNAWFHLVMALAYLYQALHRAADALDLL